MDVLKTGKQELADELDALASGRHSNAFALLGMHGSNGGRIVRTFQPQVKKVSLIDVDGNVLAYMLRIHKDGIFAGAVPPRKRHYLLRLESVTPSSSMR